MDADKWKQLAEQCFPSSFLQEVMQCNSESCLTTNFGPSPGNVVDLGLLNHKLVLRGKNLENYPLLDGMTLSAVLTELGNCCYVYESGFHAFPGASNIPRSTLTALFKYCMISSSFF